ncbi:hypothetical protein DLM45_01575 [Hyphomicrobium methylovorum]|nr:hypothetical protein [Hyphomicrobium methylovorum]
MVIDFDGDGFLRRRRIIELRRILPDIENALLQVVSPELKSYLEESKCVFEAELMKLIADEQVSAETSAARD